MLPDWRETAERQLVSSADQVVGVDYEHNALVKHRSIRQRVRADIEVLPFVSDTFDLVTANMVLEHVAAPERLLKEIFRVLNHPWWSSSCSVFEH
jgi:ubiquinone/menaquinone biosynthesis C-methylase UbiE